MLSPWYLGGNVVQYLQSHPLIERFPLILDAARGLSYLHALPLVHGDIKGENMLVDAHGSVSLCDFGMAKFIDDAQHITGLTTTNAYLGGTPRFLAPELLDDEPKTTQSDVWAFACVVVQIITDQVPYHNVTSTAAVGRAIIRGDPPYSEHCMKPIMTLNESLCNNISRCWDVHPCTRPDAESLLAIIQF
ncbi:hypothetical protein FRC03_002935 [Tulasnella sp. 419]|nr:hypothetical protein FRC03_002935 [Tulasnella sp. 419]